MPGIEITLENLSGVLVKFSEIQATSEAAAEAAVNAIAQDVANRARDLVPVRTGDLKKSIRAEPGDGPNEALVKAGGEGQGTSEQARKAGGVFYAWYVETGTRFMGARPFFRPAVEQAKSGDMAAKVAAELKTLWSL